MSPLNKLLSPFVDYYETDDEVTTTGVLKLDSVGYPSRTILNRLVDFKSGRGKYSYQRVQELERSYDITWWFTTVNLIPQVDDNFVPIGQLQRCQTDYQV